MLIPIQSIIRKAELLIKKSQKKITQSFFSPMIEIQQVDHSDEIGCPFLGNLHSFPGR